MRKQKKANSGETRVGQARAERSAGDSSEQREAEEILVAQLGRHLRVSLAKRRFPLTGGGWLELDGACDFPPVLCEAWAHLGKPKSAQKNKVMADAMKLLHVARLCRGEPRLILVLGDEEAAGHFKGKSWMAQALQASGTEVQVVNLPEETKRAIRAAQKRQLR
jgi:hypothetical protein